MSYRVDKLDDNNYSIFKDNKESYHIIIKEGKPYCDCPAFKFRQTCKHCEMIADAIPKSPDRFPREKLDRIMPILHKYFDPWCKRWEVVGSYRRGSPDFKDIDIIAETRSIDEWELMLDEIELNPLYTRKVRGDLIARGTFAGMPLDINRVAVPEDWIPQLLYRTGSKLLNIAMRTRAKSLGWTLNEHGLYDNQTEKSVFMEAISSERMIFSALGMAYKEPKDR